MSKRIDNIAGIALVVCCAGLTSCNTPDTPHEYINYIQDTGNGLHKITATDEYILDVQYEPAAYKLLKEARGKVLPDNVEEELMSMKDMHYYTLRLGTTTPGPDGDLVHYKAEDQQTYSDKLYYFSYRFQQDITLEQDGKVYPCVLYHFERFHDVKGHRNFLLGFEAQPDWKNTVTLAIDSEKLGLQDVKIAFNLDDIPEFTMSNEQ